MKKTSTLITLLLMLFVNQVSALENCPEGESNLKTIFLNTTPAIIIPEPILCKPSDISGFSVTRGFNSQDYAINWSTQDHDLWRVSSYQVRVNGVDVTSYDAGEDFPIVHSLDQGSQGVASFEVRACIEVDGVVECSDWVSTTSQCDLFCVEEELGFQVYQDEDTFSRFLEWTVDDNLLTSNPVIEYVRIRMFDQSQNVIDQYHQAIDLNSAYYFSNNFEPFSYGVSLCTAVECSAEVTDSVFDQGLTKVENVDVSWDLSNSENKKFNIEFTYPNNIFTDGHGKPQYFEIIPEFGRLNNPQDTYRVNVGSTNLALWSTDNINRNDVVGDDFSIRACRDDIGCGKPYYLSFTEPVSSDEIPVPEIVVGNQSNGTTNVNIHNFTLRWEFPSQHNGNPLTDEELSELVDYIEIVENQPYGSAYGEIWWHPNNFNPKQIKYYTEAIKDPLQLERLAKGYYGFEIKACKRDRDNGDRCSATSNGSGHRWLLNRTASLNDTNQIQNLGWYESNGKKGINWQFTATNRKPDYFRFKSENSYNAICVNYQSNGQVESTKRQFFVPYTDIDGIDFNLSDHCDDFKKINTAGNIVGDADGRIKVQACFNGVGCGGYDEYVQGNGVLAYTYKYYVNFSAPSIPAPNLQNDVPDILDGVIGGPGDMKPGAWWNPDQKGSGWHFYWASELRYPSVHKNYGKTYDLLGFWMAYMEVDGVWTPTWFFSQMKQTEGNTPSAPQFFQGDLLYLNYNKNTGKTTSTHVGRLQTHFDGNDNEHVTINVDVDFKGGVFSGPVANNDYHVSRDEYEFNLEDISIQTIGGATPENNDSDHYSGAWWHFNGGVLDEKMTWLTWIENFLEVTTVLTYDTEGDPIWVQAHTCNPDTSTNCSAVPGAGYYDSYVSPDSGPNRKTFATVRNGFNPLGKTRDGFKFVDELVYIGTGGRSFNSVDGYTNAEFWIDVNAGPGDNSLVNRSIELNYGSSRTDMEPMQKIASFHDIRFFVNNQKESITTCDPNDPQYSECQIKFTWFTDDDFPSIEPFYRFRSSAGTTWSSKQPLNDLCPGVPLNNYVVTNFVCDNFTEPGDYEFFLNKDSYITNRPPVEIAESKVLTILPCTTSDCNTLTEPQAPEQAPNADIQLDSIAVDPLNDLVGVTAGAFDVDQSGSANYTLPIYAPKGRGGLAPQLALSYNSNAGNGIAGQGWNISGASSVTRCLRSKEHDPGLQELTPITMTWDDVYCIDGMRMYKVSENTAHVEYKTELANFSRIYGIKDDAYPNGPKVFQVFTKSGEVWLYGSTHTDMTAGIIFEEGGTGAQILSNNDSGTVHTWLLAQIKDRSNSENKIRFSYDTKNGESYLSQVTWSNIEQGESPHYQINFKYDTSSVRADAMSHHGIGVDYLSLYNLKYVSTFIREENDDSANLKEVRRLKLNYEQPYSTNNPTGVLRLTSAQQCLNQGTCLRPVEFTWDDGDTEVGLSDSPADLFSGNNVGVFKEMGYGSYKPIDLNGDGHMEMMFIRGYDRGNIIEENRDARYWIAANSETIDLQGVDGVHWLWGTSGCQTLDDGNQYFDIICNTEIQPFHADEYHDFSAEMWFVYDFNADGYQDILSPQRLGDGFTNYRIFLSNGQKICRNNTDEGCSDYAPKNTTVPFTFTLSGSAFLDYTGDGMPDLLTFLYVNEDEANQPNHVPIYKYKIYPSRVFAGSHMAPDALGSYLVDLDSSQLIPDDMFCENVPNPMNPGGKPVDGFCADLYRIADDGSDLIIDKLETIPTDLNGDGLNDLMVTYTYQYLPGGLSNYETCQIPEPMRFNGDQPEEEITYTGRGYLLVEEDDLMGNTPGDRALPCEQQFKAFMIAEPDSTGQIKFVYAGRAGILKSNLSYVTSCEDGKSYSQCRANISSKHDSSRVQDINGDGLGDFVYLNNESDYKYRLNLGYTEPFIYNAGQQNEYSFDKLQFSEVKSINTVGIPNGREEVCDIRDRGDDDEDSCGRNFLTQFVDYDLDGDVDVLMPAVYVGSSVNYQLYRYGLYDGEFKYDTPVNTIISAYNTNNNRQPQDFNNALFDLDGDGHYDYFSLLRRFHSGSWNTKQITKLGANPWQTRNKITSIDTQVGGNNLDSKITIDYEAATTPLSNVYTKSTGSLTALENYGQGSPVFDILAPMYLVSQVGKTSPSDNNPNSKSYVGYAYEGFKVQGGGRGSLGFSAITTIDPHHDVNTRTEYSQVFPYIGMPIRTTVKHSAGGISSLLSESRMYYTSTTFDLLGDHQSTFPYLKRSYEKSYNLNVLADSDDPEGYNITGISDHKVMISDFYYSAADVINGNLTSSDVRTCLANTAEPQIDTSLGAICGTVGSKMLHQKVTSNEYNDDVSDWFLGRLSKTSTTEKRLRSSVNSSIDNTYQSKSRTSQFAYDPITGQLIKEEILGGNYQYLKTLYQYDDFGQSTGKYQCSNHLTDAQCMTKPVHGRNSSRSQIHRYSLTTYDPVWNEYVEYQTEPFTLYDSFEHADTNTLENAVNSFVLDQGTIIERKMSTIFPDVYGNSQKRDIYGNPYFVGDVNGFISRSVYGVFGEAHATASVAGGSSKTTKRWCEGANISTYKCPTMASTVIQGETSGKPKSRKYYDVLGREIRSQVQNFNGDWQTTDTEYDLLGRTVKQTEPFTVNNAGQITSYGGKYWTETQFDPMDRVVVIKSPRQCLETLPANNTTAPSSHSCESIDVITTTDYLGLTVSTKNSKGQVKSQVFDSLGKVIQAIDNMGEVVDYGYDAHGNLTETTSYLDNQPITITMGYDDLGRKTSMNDPDKGAWKYYYNPAGELMDQRSANTGNNQWAVKNWYDVRGRLIFRMDVDGTRSVWEYDAPDEFGLLQKEHVRGQYQSHGVAQSKTYIYDYKKRPIEVLTTVYDEYDNTSPSRVTYSSRTVYDEVGRVFQQFDNMDQSFDDNHHGVQYFYNTYGYQEAIKDAENGLIGQEYYRVLNVDHRGQVTHERHHSGFETEKFYEPSTGFLTGIRSWDEFGGVTKELEYAFDQIGNLIRRTDYEIYNDGPQDAVNEYFYYDDLNRLDYIRDDANGNGSNPYTGNIELAANYSYDESGNIKYKRGFTYEYTHPTKPHAVTKVYNNRTGANYVEKNYIYDNNGNATLVVDDVGALLSRYEYTSFDKPFQMESDGRVVDLFYNTGRSRYIRKDRKVDNSDQRVTHYLGGVEYIYEDGETRIKRHLGNVVIESKDHDKYRSRWKFSYLLKDHLGSTHTVVNKQGQQIERFSFSAFGERRRPPLQAVAPYVYWPYFGGWDGSSAMRNPVENTTNRGFTGHEHFDQVGVIHMNGRIYDPVLGRFLQADPIIQDPYDTQSLNRYSYVMNNPLSYTDPSGYSRLRKGWWRAPVAIAITIYTAGAASSVMSFINCVANSSSVVMQAMAISVVGGAAAGAVMTGDLDGAVKGGVMAAITFGIGHGGIRGASPFSSSGKMVAHSLVSGISAEVDGGKFGHGFASAMLSMGADSAGLNKIENFTGRIVSNLIVAGSVSELTGGKFANGAMSAAFRVAYNDYLEFDGENLSWHKDDGKVVENWPAESGLNFEGDDRKLTERMKSSNSGPTPEGEYTLNPEDSNYDRFWKIGWGDPDVWGSARTILRPKQGTNTFGRNQMYIHGGTGGEAPGTLGCIDISLNNDLFHRMLQDYNKPIDLSIDYGNN